MEDAMIALIKQSVLVLFFAVFSGVLVYALRMPVNEAEAMRHLPLASDEIPVESGGGRHG